MKRRYIKEVLRIMWKITDESVLRSIYIVAKTHLAILEEKGGAE